MCQTIRISIKTRIKLRCWHESNFTSCGVGLKGFVTGLDGLQDPYSRKPS